jgi:adenosine deaminase
VTAVTSAFTAGLPKAELHLHIEGTLERSLCAELAVRNGIAAPDVPPFHDLTSFLVGYYASMQVLLVEADLYDLAMSYFRTARAERALRGGVVGGCRSRRSSAGSTGRAGTPSTSWVCAPS